MNGPLFGNTGGGGSGLGQMGDAQAVAAAKNVSPTVKQESYKAKSRAKAFGNRHDLDPANHLTDAEYNGIMSCEDCNVGDHGLCAWRSVRPLHGIGSLTHQAFWV
jgi:hypothetical protein